MRKLLSVFLLFAITAAWAQTAQPTSGLAWSGYVKSDLLYDSRQTESFREGHFLLYPSNAKTDQQGLDINDQPSFNILSIQTRLNGKISGPDAFGAKTSGTIEGEFFGTSDADLPGFRLRLAFLKLDWKKLSLLAGQTWHPLFVMEMFPAVVSFNTGAPFQPFSRNPQVKLVYTAKKLKLIGVAASQRDFASNGPAGVTSAYLRNSVLPNLHAQMQITVDNHLLGAGVDYKKITPRIVTTKNFKTDQTIASTAFLGYARLDLKPVTIKMEGVYGGNLADQLMLGGYAIHSVNDATGYETYTALKCYSLWGELSVGKDIEYGLFAGYTKNLGAEENTAGSYFGRGVNIASLFRVSPRVQINSGKTRVSTEVEYTRAGYGLNNNANKGKVESVKNISNLRLLLAVYYFF